MSAEEVPTSTSVLKPIRAIQLLTTMSLFHLAVYIMLIPGAYMSDNSCLLLMAISGDYVVIACFAMMTQRDVDTIRINPLALGFSLLAIPLFIIVGLICHVSPATDTSFWAVKMILPLCFVIATIFLIELLMVLPISRKNKRILAGKFSPKEEMLVEEGPRTVPPAEPTKRDLTTSVSSLRLPPDADEKATPDHSYRKVSFGRRREYVDTPTSVPSIAAVKMAEIQTEPKRVSVEGSQTCKCELKEVLVQTVSRCEFCNQQMQAGAVPPSQQSALCGPPCPTVVQLLRGGIALPCCTNCSCTAGVLQIEQKQQPQQLQYPRLDQSQQQQRKITQKGQQVQPYEQRVQPHEQRVLPHEQRVQPHEQRVQRVQSKEIERGDGSQALTSITKVTVTAFCATPNATTMEVATSSGSKENVVTTYIPVQAATPIEVTESPQIATTSQQTEKAAFLYSKVQRVMGGHGREIESSKEQAIFASGSFEVERYTLDDEECSNPPQKITDMTTTLKSDEDDVKTDKKIRDVTEISSLNKNNYENLTDVKKNDIKESRQFQTSKPSRDAASTTKSRRGKEQTTPTKHAKKTKKSGNQTGQKERKEDTRTYSRFLPLDDIKPRESRCIEQDYDVSNICIPLHTHEVVEFPSCSGSRIISSVFQRNNRIDPAYIPECENYAIQTDPHFQCEIDTPAETCITLPVTAATTDSDICPACKKEQVQLPQADIFQYYNIYKDEEGRVYCNLCAPTSSNKVPIITDRSEDILQECCICGDFPYIIDARSLGVAYTHEDRPSYCMKCGQLQS